MNGLSRLRRNDAFLAYIHAVRLPDRSLFELCLSGPSSSFFRMVRGGVFRLLTSSVVL